eukprot:gene4391-14517_t
MSAVSNAARMSHVDGAGVSLMGWGSLVTTLVALHLLAFLVWVAILITNEMRSRKSEKKD